MKQNLGKPILTIIQSTHFSLSGLEQSGLLERHRCLLAEYSKKFHIVLYTCDNANYSRQLSVEHHPVPWLPQVFGLWHLVFYLWLVWRAPSMKGVIKVFGCNIPTLPIVKFLSMRPMMVTYQYDYAGLAEQMFGRKSIMALLGRWMQYLALQSADLISVTTTALKEKAEQSYHKPIVLLPNWVDIKQCLLTSGNRRDPYLILYAGRLHKIKGLDVLIDAFSQVKRHQSEARLVICGAGEEEENLRIQVKTLALANVEFKGRVQNAEVLRLMQSAAIFVLPTLAMEGHPKALIEAMACGAACVASNVPGNNTIITDGENGILTPPNDVQSLSKAINNLLSRAELRQELGFNAKTDASRYDFALIVSEEMEILHGMVDDK